MEAGTRGRKGETLDLGSWVLPTGCAIQASRKMERLASHLLWYNRRLVSTANAEALTRLADLLERGDYQAVRRYISTLDDALDIRNGENACVETDGSRFSVVLPEALLRGFNFTFTAARLSRSPSDRIVPSSFRSLVR